MKDVLPHIPADRARVEQFEKTLLGFRHQHDRFLVWDNALLIYGGMQSSSGSLRS